MKKFKQATIIIALIFSLYILLYFLLLGFLQIYKSQQRKVASMRGMCYSTWQYKFVYPGDSFYDGCNSCTCGREGKGASCQLMACYNYSSSLWYPYTEIIKLLKIKLEI